METIEEVWEVLTIPDHLVMVYADKGFATIKIQHPQGAVHIAEGPTLGTWEIYQAHPEECPVGSGILCETDQELAARVEALTGAIITVFDQDPSEDPPQEHPETSDESPVPAGQPPQPLSLVEELAFLDSLAPHMQKAYVQHREWLRLAKGSPLEWLYSELHAVNYTALGIRADELRRRRGDIRRALMRKISEARDSIHEMEKALERSNLVPLPIERGEV